MSKSILILALCCIIGSVQAQTLKSGYYVTDDGTQYRNIEVLEDGTIKAGISVGYDLYEKMSGNKYKGKATVIDGVSSTPSKVFYLEVISETSIYLYREGQDKTILRYKDNEEILESLDDCTLYQKYIDKMEDEPDNIPTLSFCANAALQLCNAPDDAARNTILEQTVKSLKVLLPGESCPCSDVIPASAWNKY